jgi:ubiquinone/menaquinone biosynthesis C-methylase UbiE
MHDSAYKCAEDFYNKYCKHKNGFKVIDFGSKDFNGSLKPIFNNTCYYTGIDMEEGKNVDVVCNNHSVPFDNESFNVVLSSSCFEHDGMFWQTFLEMCRLTKKGGYIYIQAPANGPYHAYPHDCWRFYLDSWKSLELWGVKNGYEVKLIEHYIMKPQKYVKVVNWFLKVIGVSPFNAWDDSVGIFKMN